MAGRRPVPSRAVRPRSDAGVRLTAPRHVVVVGLMASGKTTIGAMLAARLHRRFVDSDDELERRTGHTAAEVQRGDGAGALHAVERDLLLEELASDTPAVIAAAASTIEDDACRAALTDAFVVWMRADADVLAERVRTKAHRPLDADVATQLRTQAARRDRLFASVADLTIDANTFDADAVLGFIADVIS